MCVMSIRFPDESSLDRLRDHAHRRDSSMSSLAARLIEEGLRMEEHPAICFRDGPAGRRAVLVGGPEVADVVSALVGGDVPVEERRARVAEMMCLRESLVDAALAYYAEHTAEMDAEIAAQEEVTEKYQALWERQQTLLAR
ncbi:MAG: CopG family transcriptional regulator [Acidimicrobiia bacterium]|nr:CopG family transcriptional regulator [Acidimicrobiia bacterium]MYL09102.1 CopG family transcriptional regulator [Acidimicrobiia bacterium]